MCLSLPDPPRCSAQALGHMPGTDRYLPMVDKSRPSAPLQARLTHWTWSRQKPWLLWPVVVSRGVKLGVGRGEVHAPCSGPALHRPALPPPRRVAGTFHASAGRSPKPEPPSFPDQPGTEACSLPRRPREERLENLRGASPVLTRPPHQLFIGLFPAGATGGTWVSSGLTASVVLDGRLFRKNSTLARHFGGPGRVCHWGLPLVNLPSLSLPHLGVFAPECSQFPYL